MKIKRILRNALFAIIIHILLAFFINYMTSLKILDNNEIEEPPQIEVIYVNSKDSNAVFSAKRKVIEDKDIIKELTNEIKNAALRKRGIFYGRVYISTPHCVVLPSFGNNQKQNLYYYLDKDGKIVICVGGEIYEGIVSSDISEKIIGLF